MRAALRGHRFFTARIDGDRRPQFDGLVLNGKLKSFRHYTDDSVVLAVEHHCFADDVRIGTEAILPESIAQNNNATGVTWLVFFGLKRSTKDRRRTQQRKQIGVYDRALEPRGFIDASQNKVVLMIRRHPFEDLALISPIGEVGIRHRTLIDATLYV